LSGAYVTDLDGAPPRRIVEADGGVEYGSGKLFFVIQGTLFAQSFDPDRAELTGQRIAVAQQVATLGPRAAMSISNAGPIIYRTAAPDVDVQLAWLNRTGREIQSVGEPFMPGFGVALSPDERFVAYVRRTGTTTNLALRDLNRNITTPFASEGADPAWSPDGSRLAYCKGGAMPGVFQKLVTSDGSEELLAQRANSPDWSANGYVLFDRADLPTQPEDLLAQPVNAIGKASGQAVPVLHTPADEKVAKFSPDGKWIAYSSNKSGQREIYVRSFTGKGPEVQISINGGVQVRWRRDGNEIFYIALDGRLMAVQVKVTGGVIEPTTPIPLFTMHAFGTFESRAATYDVSADGQRFLVLTSKDAASPWPIKLILNWSGPH
jgi:dipeptidyl aminopeptidase/acylaminoacyl peptidase